MRITIDLPDFEAEDNVAIAQVFYSLGSAYENKDEDEPVLLGTENGFVRIDDWDAKARITIER